MPYNVTIGATDPGTSDAHFTTWRLFLESNAPGITQQDWVVTFLDGEDHQAEQGQTSFTQGNWQTECINLTVTSEGFTGIPYGQPGGSTSRLSFDYSGSSKIFFGVDLGGVSGFGDVTFQDIEIMIGGASSNSVGMIRMGNTGPGHKFVFNRCVISDFTCSGSNTQNIFWLDGNAGDGFKLRNVRVWNVDFKSGNYCCVARYNAYAGSEGGWDVSNCEFVNLRGTGSDQDVFNSSNTAETAPENYRTVKNCIFDTSKISGPFDPQFTTATYQTGNITSDDGLIYNNQILMRLSGIDGYNGDYSRGPNGAINSSGVFNSSAAYATWYMPIDTWWALIIYDDDADEWEYGLTFTDPTTLSNGASSGLIGASVLTATSIPLGSLSTPWDASTTGYPYSDIWSNPGGGDWSSVGPNNFALLAGDRLSTNPASDYSIDIYGNTRDVSATEWDAGSTAWSASTTPVNVSTDIEATLRTSGLPSIVGPAPVNVSTDIEATLRTAGTPSVVVPEQDGYNNPSDIVYTNPSGIVYNGVNVEQVTASILGLSRSSGSPSITNPPQNTSVSVVALARTSGAPVTSGPDPVNVSTDIEASLRTSGLPSIVGPTPVNVSTDIEASLRTSGTPTVTTPDAECISSQSIGDIRTVGTPSVVDPSTFINSDIFGTLRTSGAPSVVDPAVSVSSNIFGTLRTSGTPSVTIPPGVTSVDIEAALRTAGTPTVTTPDAECISSQSIGDIRTVGTPSVTLPSDFINSDVFGTLRTSGTPTVTEAETLSSDIEATLRTSGTPAIVAPMSSVVRGTLRTAGIPYVNTGWTNPRGCRLFIVPQDFRHFIVPFDNRNFEVI
jgi:hypothetical protein